jgi:hypothetical protein
VLDVDCTGETQSVDQLFQLTVFAPNGTAAQLRVPGTADVLTGIGSVGSDKKHVFDVIKGTWDLYLNQGAGEGGEANVDCSAGESGTVDELCQLTVFAPNGTAAQVRVADTADALTGIGSVGSDKKHVFDVIKGTWDLYLNQGAGENTVEDLDCAGETQSVDQLVQWTVFAPNGTELKVYTADRAGTLATISSPGSDKKHIFDVIPGTYDLYLKQGAQETWLDDVAVLANLTSDQLCQLTVFAPNGTALNVYVIDTTDVIVGISSPGSDNKAVFDVVKNTYDVYAATTPPQTAEDVDCTGDTQSVSF